MTDRECRELGPEMKAEGWFALPGDSVMWCCEPAGKVVLVDGPWKRSFCFSHEATAPGETIGPDDDCYKVCVYGADEHGYPIDGDYDGFLTASYGKALKAAREARLRILSQCAPKPQPDSRQVTFDDLLAKGGSL